MFFSTRLRAGDWVEVKSKEEILATLDGHGRLDGLPFMPEMFEFCGQRLRVAKRAHKTCDPPSGLGGRRMSSAVHLEGVRCDGQAHGGCQAGCLIFWKEAWLRTPDSRSSEADSRGRSGGCSEQDVRSGAMRGDDGSEQREPVYVCQSTQVFQATERLAWWDPRQYFEDYASGNVGAGQILAALLFTLYQTLAEAGVGLGGAMRWAYDRFQSMRGGTPYPVRHGTVPPGQATPKEVLDLSPGELVRVKSYGEILATLNETARNRGLYFDPDYVPFCGKTFPVLRRVERIVDEKTGKMIQLKTDAIILEGVACGARYAKCRRFCPRGIFAFWREIWLERVGSQ